MKQIIELPLKIGQIIKIKNKYYKLTVSKTIGCIKCDCLKECEISKMKSFCNPWSNLKLLDEYQILFLKNNIKILNLPLKENDIIKLKGNYYKIIKPKLKENNFACRKCCFNNKSINFCSHLANICNNKFIFKKALRGELWK